MVDWFLNLLETPYGRVVFVTFFGEFLGRSPAHKAMIFVNWRKQVEMFVEDFCGYGMTVVGGLLWAYFQPMGDDHWIIDGMKLILISFGLHYAWVWYFKRKLKKKLNG